MKISSLIEEDYECVKIHGTIVNMSNDESNLYNKLKSERIYKDDLSEYETTVANRMVNRGLIKRCKEKESGKLYFCSKGRKCYPIQSSKLEEVAPPSTKMEKWINKNKRKFKDEYGKDYKKYLYGHAWSLYNKKKEK